MGLLVKADNIFVEYLDRLVLKVPAAEIYEGERIGIVGRNGAGKSTLMNILSGIDKLAGCNRQVFGSIAHIQQLIGITAKEFENISDKSLIGKLHVSNLQIETASGGETTKMKIAAALAQDVHGIFTDEPTCNLDEESVDFLISQLSYYTGALLLISHDRHFLDSLVEKIWEVSECSVTVYFGNYSDYLFQKEEIRNSQMVKYRQYIDEKSRLEKAAEEKSRQARDIDKKTKEKKKTESAGRTKPAKTVGSKQKSLHNAAKNIEQRIETLEEIKPPESAYVMRFKQSPALIMHNKFPVMAEGLHKSFGEKVIFLNASFSLPLGSKAALTGLNGVGKTTLLKMILNREPGLIISPKAEIGYFAQNGYLFPKAVGLMEFMSQDCDYNQTEIRAALASIGFYNNDLKKMLGELSGGEIVKCLLCKMLMNRYNILLLDEPLNFLDTQSIEALERMIKGYLGTVLFVTHDRQAVKNVADVIYRIENGKIIMCS